MAFNQSPLEQLAASASELRASQGSPSSSPEVVNSPMYTGSDLRASQGSTSGISSPEQLRTSSNGLRSLRVDMKSDEERTKKRQLRLLKNRQSAALSRQRKKEYISDLEVQTGGLVSENIDLKQKLAKISSLNIDYKSHIEHLEKQVAILTNENKGLKLSLSSNLLPPQDPHPHPHHEPSSILAAISKASA